MARIRTIKPEMSQDEDLAGCSIEAQLLAVRILNHADDEGYFKANERLVRAACFPLMDHSLNIHGMITELSKIGYLQLAEGVDGKQYGKIINFNKHQKINRPYDSKIKDLVTFTEYSRNDHGTLTPGTGNREQGTGNRERIEGKPSLSPEEPATDDEMPACPHMKIIDLYHQTLPTLPRVVKELWHESESATHLKARWRTLPAHQNLDFWREYFEVVKTNPHWLGENDRAWTASLHWLVNRTNFNKVMTRWNSLMEAA